MMRRLVPFLLAGLACRSGSPPLHPAGSGHDDGHGDLARAALHFTRAEDSEGVYVEPAQRDDGEYGGNTYGGAVPPWQYTAPNRVKYPPATNAASAIEGVISWRGAVPARRTTSCGAIEVLRLGDKRGIADVLVYIERVKTARAVPNEGRPASVGGVIVKRGCALLPAVQIVTPLPAALSLNGDDAANKIRVTPPTGEPKVHALEEGGRVSLAVIPGITRVDAEAGDLGAAWVVAIDTPYYAITDDDGRFRIDELPPGTYELTIWQAPLPRAGKALTYGPPVIVRRTVTVGATRPARLDVSLGP